MNGTQEKETVDVLVVGGGPVGLITTYALLKEGIKVINIEKYDNGEQGNYGRACILYPRSLEILEQLGLYDEIRELGFTVKDAVTYKDGKATDSRGWSSVQRAIEGATNYNFCLGIRQQLSEEAFRYAIRSLDLNTLRSSAKLLDFYVDPSLEYPVSAKVDFNGRVKEINSKFIIGADGSRSTVREFAKIPFPGSKAGRKWVRLDAIVKTDMPESRTKSIAVESLTHGNVLWTFADHGRTRIGFVWKEELPRDAETVMAEAKKAVAPFTLEFIKLDWWTVYSIGQHVAESFKKGPVFLAGDAAHTHSSGAAQGMNTGIHDASNLAWKLAGVLKGYFAEEVLDTYADERKKSAEQLIQIDKDMSACISGVIPAHFNAPPDADANEYLEKIMATNIGFTVGLGIYYQENLVNGSSKSVPLLNVKVGHRAPDPGVFQHGEPYARRLHSCMPNRAKFWVLVFPGGLDPNSNQRILRATSRQRFASLRAYLNRPSSFVNTLMPAFNFITIIGGDRIYQSAETLGSLPLGKVLHDRTGEAYEMYGVDDTEGALVVLRPDGVVGFYAGLDQFELVGEYFSRFVPPAIPSMEKERHLCLEMLEGQVSLGEISIEYEAEERKVT